MEPPHRQPIEALLGHAGRAARRAFSADSHTLYTTSLDGAVLEWDLGGARRFGRPFTTGATRAPAAVDRPADAAAGDLAESIRVRGADGRQQSESSPSTHCERRSSLTVQRAATITRWRGPPTVASWPSEATVVWCSCGT